eukprot:11143555-Alexandrium_andersonii.AAC.1
MPGKPLRRPKLRPSWSLGLGARLAAFSRLSPSCSGPLARPPASWPSTWWRTPRPTGPPHWPWPG